MGVFTINVGAVRLRVSPKLDDDTLDILRKNTKYRIHGYQFMTLYKQGRWDGYKFLFYKRDQSAPSGCYLRIHRELKRLGYSVKIKFAHDYPPQGAGTLYGFTLVDFQQTAAELVLKHRYCIISAPVRSGKTLIIAKVLSTLGQYPAWVVTQDKDLVNQTREDLQNSLHMPIGVFSESVYEPKDITVSSYQALVRIFSDTGRTSKLYDGRNNAIKESMHKTKALLLDECHFALAPKNSAFIQQFDRVGYRIGFSGTPKPDKKNMKELETVIGPIVMRVPFKKLIDTGRIVQPYVILYNLPHLWFRSHLSEYSDLYQANIVENYFRNKFIAQTVSELKQKKLRSYIIVRRKYHGELLQNLIPDAVYIYGDVSSDVRRMLYDRLQTGKLHCIISTVGKHGLNLPKLDAVINAEGYKSSVVTTQKMRSLTASEGKKYGIVVDFLDKGKDLRDHSDLRKQKYNSFDGFIIEERQVKKNHFDLEQMDG